MKKFLFVKFITAMIFLGILGFTAISLVGTDLVEDHVEKMCIRDSSSAVP